MKKSLLFILFFQSCFVFAQSKKEQIKLLTARVDSLIEEIKIEEQTSSSTISNLNQEILDLNERKSLFEDENEKEKSELIICQEYNEKLEQNIKIKSDSINKILNDDLLSNEKYYQQNLKIIGELLNSNANTKINNSFDIKIIKQASIIKDIDGNSYKTVQIGDQLWMAENLKVSRYNDGTNISNISNKTIWKDALKNKKDAWCYYENNISNGKIYGKLYNWFVVRLGVNGLKNVCPIGWHVPSETEWQVLFNNLGGIDIAGDKMKEVGFSHWKYPNKNASNIAFFNGLPGGSRNEDGNFHSLGENGWWWCSSDYEYSSYNDNVAPDIGLNSNNSNVSTGGEYPPKSWGISIRCIYGNYESLNPIKGVVGPKIKDIDGNVYKTVYIGEQHWMQENLRVSKFNDGTKISNVIDNKKWTENVINFERHNTSISKDIALSRAAWCYYENNVSFNLLYGKIYNSYVVNLELNGNTNVCPKGWHVPTEKDWEVLTKNLGNEKIAGGMMKSVGIKYWNPPNEDAYNLSLFSGLPGGYRHGDGNFYSSMGKDGHWWSNTFSGRSVTYNSGIVRLTGDREHSFSIRCIED